MAYSTRSYARPFVGGAGIPQGVKLLLISNIAIFLLMLVLGRTETGQWITSTFALTPADVVNRFYIWQPLTYLFIHAGIGHILFNMLALWFLGGELERVWGMQRFLNFYFLCGIGAGICVIIAHYLFGNPNVTTVGASGALYGVLLVAAMLWPDQMMILYFFPIKLKYLVMILAAMSVLGVFDANSGVSDVAHLSGMGFGYLYLKSAAARSFDPWSGIRKAYKDWKMARAKKKFQVYMNKHRRSDGDPWVN